MALSNPSSSWLHERLHRESAVELRGVKSADSHLTIPGDRDVPSWGPRLSSSQRTSIPSIRRVNTVTFDDLSDYQDSIVFFRTFIFFKECIYQTIQYLALPWMLCFDGGFRNARLHGFLPYCTSLHPASMVGHMVWLGWIGCNAMWFYYDLGAQFEFELLLLNCNFLFRVVSVALRYAYLTENEVNYILGQTNSTSRGFKGSRGSRTSRTRSRGARRARGARGARGGKSNAAQQKKRNINEMEGSVTSTMRTSGGHGRDMKTVFAGVDLHHTMLLFGWGFYKPGAILYERANAELRLNWDKQNEEDKIINVQCKKFHTECTISVDRFVAHLIEETSYLQKRFWYCAGMAGITAITSCVLNWIHYSMNQDAQNTINMIFMILWSVGLVPVLGGNIGYVWCGAIDFIRLNHQLTLTDTLIMPLQMRKYYKSMAKFNYIYNKVTKGIFVSNFIVASVPSSALSIAPSIAPSAIVSHDLVSDRPILSYDAASNQSNVSVHVAHGPDSSRHTSSQLPAAGSLRVISQSSADSVNVINVGNFKRPAELKNRSQKKLSKQAETMLNDSNVAHVQTSQNDENNEKIDENAVSSPVSDSKVHYHDTVDYLEHVASSGKLDQSDSNASHASNASEKGNKSDASDANDSDVIVTRTNTNTQESALGSPVPAELMYQDSDASENESSHHMRAPQTAANAPNSLNSSNSPNSPKNDKIDKIGSKTVKNVKSSKSSKSGINLDVADAREGADWSRVRGSMIINVRDIHSLYNWLSARHYFLEFGKGFRLRELAINATGLLLWLLILALLLYQTFVQRSGEPVQSVKIGLVLICIVMFLVPTFITAFVASKIQTNFKLEMQILEERSVEENLKHCYDVENVVKQLNEGSEMNEMSEEMFESNLQRLDAMYYEYHSSKVGFDTIMKMLKNDSENYRFAMFGYRVDQGVVHLIWPVVLSVITIFVRVAVSTYT